MGLRCSLRLSRIAFSVFAFALFCTTSAVAQAPEWAWMGGSNLCCQAGVYGTEYQFSATNVPPPRTNAVTWTDRSGRLWLFGGTGFDWTAVTYVDLNDLWVFDPTLGSHGQWAWMGGSSFENQNGVYGTEYQFDPGNVPGARSSAISWTDLSGRLWVFGGDGYDSAGNGGALNDFWIFDPSQGTHGEWAWMGGSATVSTDPYGACYGGQNGVLGTEYQFAPANVPGSLEAAASWTDGSGNLWLFGGWGCEPGAGTWLNFLWVFDPSQGAHGEWAWMGGSSPGDQPGVFGPDGQFDEANWPGNSGSATWKDPNGNVWTFGTFGGLPNGAFSDDLWVFDQSRGAHGEWARISADSAGAWGTPYKFDSANIPSGRNSVASWTGPDGEFWLFGGFGYGSNGEISELNDLWAFDPSLGTLGEWAWMGGSDGFIGGCPGGFGACRPGVYGTEYQFGGANTPGGRYAGATWTDGNGQFWLFGGYGSDSLGNMQLLNDLWELKVLPSEVAAPTFSPTAGTYNAAQQVSILDADTGATIYYTTDGTTPTIHSAVFNSGSPINVSANTTVKALAVESGLKNSAVATANYVLKVPEPTIGLAAGTYSTTQQAAITDGTSNAAIWYTTDGSTPAPNGGTSSLYNGSPVQITENTELKAVAAVTGWTTSTAASAKYTLKVAEPLIGLTAGTYSTPQQAAISDSNASATIWYTTDGMTPVPGASDATQYVSGNPVEISQSTTLKAVAAISGWTTSTAASAKYTLKVPEPVISLATGSYSTAQQASISDSNASAAIWYTTDGMTPVPGASDATQYMSGNPVQIDQTTTLKAVAAVTGWTTSVPASASYTFKVPTPTFSLAAGTYSSPQSTMISDADGGATIWYTTDGTTPVPGAADATQYAGGMISINATTKLKAVAAESGWTTSAAAAATYTIKALVGAGLLLQKETTLYAFTGNGNGTNDGWGPSGNLVMDSQHNLYGTTTNGGSDGDGAVFKLSPSGVETMVHNFSDEPDGASPEGGVVMDGQGNFYGTTTGGGTGSYSSDGIVYSESGGTVYKIAPDGTETVLQSFSSENSPQGFLPYDGLTVDSKGNLYGTTTAGGNNTGCGVVFEVNPGATPGNAETVLYSFSGPDGCSPGEGDVAGGVHGGPGLAIDGNGSIFGTTYQGGANGQGVVFELTPNGSGGYTEGVLHSFSKNGPEGQYPLGGLHLDSHGNLYGVTSDGGYFGSGTIFKVEPGGAVTVLYSSGSQFNVQPGLVMDGLGNLYGSTGGDGGLFEGTVFELAPSGVLTVVCAFPYSSPVTEHGTDPQGGLLLAEGNLYGTTGTDSVYSSGLVFELSPAASVVAPPVLSLSPGTYSSPQTLAITDSTANTTIYYTVDGQIASSNDGTLYRGSLTINSPTLISAVAVAPDGTASAPVQAFFNVQ